MKGLGVDLEKRRPPHSADIANAGTGCNLALERVPELKFGTIRPISLAWYVSR
jgi:hypothetical protein